MADKGNDNNVMKKITAVEGDKSDNDNEDGGQRQKRGWWTSG